MKKCKTLLLIACTLLIAVTIAIAAQNQGAEKITLSGGKTGDVSVPHHQHQNALNDCTPCHKLFPQEAGAIGKLKTEGTLKARQVMNECTGCHKAKKEEGAKTGPVSCKQCHVKN